MIKFRENVFISKIDFINQNEVAEGKMTIFKKSF